MASVNISDLITITSITDDDFFPLVDSGSLTTYRVSFTSLKNWLAGSMTASYALSALTASYAATASFVATASSAKTASYLLYRGFPNGTASYALTASHATTASYVNTSGLSVAYATYALSASWASSSISASYVPAAGVDGTVTSASYAVTASHAINANYGISASYAKSASYAGTSSHALYAQTTINNPVSLYGPFTASANISSPVIGWSQWDEEKRAITFTLASDGDVLIECIVNYAVDELSTVYYYIGGLVRAQGVDDPTVNPPINVAALDDFKFVSCYAFEGNARIDSNVKLYIRKTGLTAGTYVLYLMRYQYSAANISPWGTSGVAQKATLDTFLASVPTPASSAQLRIYKFANSVSATIYSTAAVTQAIL